MLLFDKSTLLLIMSCLSLSNQQSCSSFAGFSPQSAFLPPVMQRSFGQQLFPANIPRNRGMIPFPQRQYHNPSDPRFQGAFNDKCLHPRIPHVDEPFPVFREAPVYLHTGHMPLRIPRPIAVAMPPKRPPPPPTKPITTVLKSTVTVTAPPIQKPCITANPPNNALKEEEEALRLLKQESLNDAIDKNRQLLTLKLSQCSKRKKHIKDHIQDISGKLAQIDKALHDAQRANDANAQKANNLRARKQELEALMLQLRDKVNKQISDANIQKERAEALRREADLAEQAAQTAGENAKVYQNDLGDTGRRLADLNNGLEKYLEAQKMYADQMRDLERHHAEHLALRRQYEQGYLAEKDHQNTLQNQLEHSGHGHHAFGGLSV